MTDTAKFTPDWPHGHQLSDGRSARIICTDAKGSQPIIALIMPVGGVCEDIMCFYPDGGPSRAYFPRLINAPVPKRMIWLNWYDNDTVAVLHYTKEEANLWAAGASSSRIALTCHEVPERGTGLGDVE